MRGRAEVETSAERLFKALGYRRRADEGTDGERLVFTRGRPLASLYTSSLRRCQARVVVVHKAGAGENAGEVWIAHHVETRGRIVTGEDAGLLDAEARAFERFLEHADLDTAALLDASRRASRNQSLLQIGLLILVIGTVVAVAAVTFWSGFWRER